MLSIKNKLQLKIFYCSKKHYYYKKIIIISIINPYVSINNDEMLCTCKHTWVISNSDPIYYSIPFVIRIDNENYAYIGNGWCSINMTDKDEICKILSTEYRKYNKISFCLKLKIDY